MRLISLFQNITKATARDCLDDEKQNKIINRSNAFDFTFSKCYEGNCS